MPTKTRYGDSPWILNVPDARRPKHPKLRGTFACDVAIIGGGLTGMVAAYSCAMAGLETIVVEAGRVGSGGSGRAAGLLLPTPGPAYRDVQRTHGLRIARTVFDTWRRASMDAATMLRRLSIACALAPVETLTIGHDEKMLRAESAARAAAGVEGRFLTARQVRPLAQLEAGGLRQGDAYALDPFRACLGLALAARKRGVRIAEQTTIRGTTFGSTGVELSGDGLTIGAATVVVTTGTATDEFKPLLRHFTRRDRYLVLTEPVPASVRKQLFASDKTVGDTSVPPHRVRWTPDHRLLVAGADQDAQPARSHAAVLVQRTGQLMYELLTMYPAISGLRPAYGWDCSYGDTADGLPYVGAHRNYPHHLFALGGRSDSITGSFLAGRLLARAAARASTKSDEVFGWTR